MTTGDEPRARSLRALAAALPLGILLIIGVGYVSARREAMRADLAEALASSRLPRQFTHNGTVWHADELEEPHDPEVRLLRPIGRLPDGHMIYAPPGPLSRSRKLLLKVEQPASLAGTWIEYERNRS